jgi:UDP-3-O-acyl N-acetylglucosamine deacetylase
MQNGADHNASQRRSTIRTVSVPNGSKRPIALYHFRFRGLCYSILRLMILQKTIARECTVEGVGFIHDRHTHVVVSPAAPGRGISFVRADLPQSPIIPMQPRYQVPGEHCTTLKNGDAFVLVVEHFLSACAILGVRNLNVRIDSPEMPTCDGSALPWAQVMLDAGLVEQPLPVPEIHLRNILAVSGEDGAVIIAVPSETASLSYLLDYRSDPEIGCSHVTVDPNDTGLLNELAPARTFIMEEDARAALDSGRIKSTNESLGLVIHRGLPPVLRMPDELARHKILDMMGDLFILGCEIRARFIGIKSGHKLNAKMARELAARYPRAI